MKLRETGISHRGGYLSPEIEVLLCSESAPLLDSPGGGFGGDEGGLEEEDLD